MRIRKKTLSGTNRYCIHLLNHQEIKATCLNKGGIHGNLRSLGYDGSLSSQSFSFSFVCQSGGKAAISSRVLLCSRNQNNFRAYLSLIPDNFVTSIHTKTIGRQTAEIARHEIKAS